MTSFNASKILSNLIIRDIVSIETPGSKRDIPCDSCTSYNHCTTYETECSAFRNWAHFGDYKDTDIKRFLRAFKSE